jgi:hypothetical protein
LINPNLISLLSQRSDAAFRHSPFLIFLSPWASFYFLYADESVLLVHQCIKIYPRDQMRFYPSSEQYIARYTQ